VEGKNPVLDPVFKGDFRKRGTFRSAIYKTCLVPVERGGGEKGGTTGGDEHSLSPAEEGEKKKPDPLFDDSANEGKTPGKKSRNVPRRPPSPVAQLGGREGKAEKKRKWMAKSFPIMFFWEKRGRV